jgi:hypothetical protein
MIVRHKNEGFMCIQNCDQGRNCNCKNRGRDVSKEEEIKRQNEKIEFLSITNMLYSEFEHRGHSSHKQIDFKRY